jgi:endonuclease/exonuclease/phosphatase family metal-dependent hydrolase
LLVILGRFRGDPGIRNANASATEALMDSTRSRNALTVGRGSRAGMVATLTLALSATALAADLPFTVMSYNVAGAMCGNPIPGGGCLFVDPTPQMTRLAAMIREQQVDVVGLQEVERWVPRHLGKDMLALLLAELDRLGYPMEARWVPVYTGFGGEHGQATLSRYPITHHTLHDLGCDEWGYCMRADVAELSVAGETVRVVNYHPVPTNACAWVTPPYVNVIRRYLDGTAFLVGDFNLGRASACFADLTATHVDSCAAGGDPSCSCTVDYAIRTDITTPCGAIDFVFHRFAGSGAARWQLASAAVDPAANQVVAISDHFPVLARFARCADECTAGARECSGTGVRLCGNFDADGCAEWGPTTACPAAQACVAGSCVCQNECEPGDFVCEETAGSRGMTGTATLTTCVEVNGCSQRVELVCPSATAGLDDGEASACGAWTEPACSGAEIARSRLCVFPSCASSECTLEVADEVETLAQCAESERCEGAACVAPAAEVSVALSPDLEDGAAARGDPSADLEIVGLSCRAAPAGSPFGLGAAVLAAWRLERRRRRRDPASVRSGWPEARPGCSTPSSPTPVATAADRRSGAGASSCPTARTTGRR